MTDQTPGSTASSSVTAQMPRVGPAIPSGSRVVVRVSKGTPPTPPSSYVTIPSLTGAQQGDALSALQAVGLAVEVFNDASASVARGKVIGELPHAGESVAAGTQVVLLVSSGPPANPTSQVGLPIVVGMTEANATNALRASGLNPQVVEEYSSNVPQGVVIDQLPSASSVSEVVPKKRSMLWLWILIAVLVVGLVGYFAYAAFARTATVPNVVSMTQANAESAITAAGFKVGSVGTTQTSSSADVGKVVAEDPLPGTQARVGSNINIVVSGGQKLVSVPAVTGMTQADAQSALTAAGLTSQVTKGNSSTVPKGSVISQAPAAGQQVPSGTSVGIVVSQGKGNVTVPNVTGMTQSEAQNALKSAGLGSQVITNADAAPKGQVYEQAPSAGTVVAPGTAISIHVSSGPPPTPTTVTVPKVIGQTQTDATSQLQGLGFKVSVSQVASGTPNTVVAQTPAANTKAQKGSTVSIVVAQ